MMTVSMTMTMLKIRVFMIRTMKMGNIILTKAKTMNVVILAIPIIMAVEGIRI